MDPRGFLNSVLGALKSRLTSIVTRLKLYTSKNFWRTKVFSKFRELFSKLFDVKPKNAKDYYTVGRWMVSRKLAHAVVLAFGVVCLVFLLNSSSVFFGGGDSSLKTYRHNSILLKFADRDVRIKGRGGYIAYEGAVSKGAANGFGTLYDRDKNMVYQGEFVDNKYCGQGTSYFPGGAVTYTGDFADNLYNGKGTLYRPNGSMEYQGEFSRGLKHGTGNLYNDSSTLVFTGSFSQDHIVFSNLLDKTAPEVREMYKGDWVSYESSDGYAVYLPDIGAVYEASLAKDSVADEVKVYSVYVLDSVFYDGSKECDTISEVSEVLGSPVYEGNSEATMAEAVCIHELCKESAVLGGNIEMTLDQDYEEHINVKGFADDYTVYLYSFQKNGLVYTFVCNEKESDFAFYYIEQGSGEE